MNTAAHVLVTKDKVQRYLTDLVGNVEISPNGDFTFRHGSSRIFIRCESWREDRTLVVVTVPLLFKVPPSPELFHHIATHADDWHFGHLSAHEEEDGTVLVLFTHSLLGDYLDPDELHAAVGGMAGVADQVDTALQAKFGGETFHDDVA